MMAFPGTTGGRSGAAADAAAPRTAFVLSGGGAKGSYEVGVMKALFEGASPSTGFQPPTADIYTGTSVGSYNACFMVSRGGRRSDLEAVLALERGWRQRVADTSKSCGNGIFRVRAAPTTFFEPGCWLHPVETVTNFVQDTGFLSAAFAAETFRFLTSTTDLETRVLDSINISIFFSVEPLHELIRDTIDFDAIGTSPKDLSIIASDFKRGIPRVFSKREVVEIGEKTILASAAIPGLFPPVEIGDSIFVDGGVTMNTPLVPAFGDGAESLHVIFVDPALQEMPFPSFPNTFDTLYRLYVILIADRFKLALERVRSLGREVRLLKKFKLKDDELKEELAEIERLVPEAASLRVKETFRLPEIHVYRPDSDLGGLLGLLDFGQGYIDELIQLGYTDTVAHDCTAQGCLVPERVK